MLFSQAIYLNDTIKISNLSLVLQLAVDKKNTLPSTRKSTINAP